ncbi:uncharacterized protein GGS22DRAFT_175756 [Annulohypoxylon maeteangense]|uniref:uncharacterized protein n=1 Tax=Annulohypoxylon maeteangense TaxID=1927788 RepID=UPI002008CE07|nr:uncharacterized protein GGS22DRAFT_175756 [Annulohypoxylon maeteangense]KAI0880188.1 hypothetical protein GGS22DRAFT_175756 [Annulohypoxylon maeteangense]
MLRHTRSVLAKFVPTISPQRASISPLLSLQHRAATRTGTPNLPPPRTLFSHSSLPVQKAKYSTKTPSGLQYGRDPEEEKRFGQQKLQSDPGAVTTESSVRHVYEPSSQGKQKPIKHGVKDDIETIKETFTLSDVPKEPYILGIAGTLPYLATSISTVYLSWDLNTEWPSTSNFVNNFLISHDTAQHLLGVIEPIQLGYGAIIISFLGAVHWGMEYTEKVPDPDRTRFRYGLGVLASVVAWPTLLMPMDFALTSQFAAFVMLYFADARATVRAWAPSWYGTYRFVLTAIVGAAIFISLIGRMKVGDAKSRLTSLSDKLHERGREEDYTKKWEELEEKEKEKVQKEKKQKDKEAKERAKSENREKGKEKSTEKSKGSKAQNDKDKDGSSQEGKREDREEETEK